MDGPIKCWRKGGVDTESNGVIGPRRQDSNYIPADSSLTGKPGSKDAVSNMAKCHTDNTTFMNKPDMLTRQQNTEFMLT